jgi:superfamily II DNA or RNA helicase
MLTIDTPTTVRLEEHLATSALQRFLSYTDKSAEFTYRKARKSQYLAIRMGESYGDYLMELKSQINKSLLFEDEKGLFTYSGLGGYLANHLHDTLVDTVPVPESGSIPWFNTPKHTPYPFQVIAWDKLASARHGAVEIGTGLGKSFIIELLVKHYGLKTVIMCPSKSIANQLYHGLSRDFGIRYVGKFFDGKKESKKLFVVAVDKSLSLVKEGSDHWKNLSAAKVFIADESHLCPASTLAKICFGLMKESPLRFFFSGTQMRNDGADLLLEGITGPVVFQMTVREGVDQGYLAKPLFTMVGMESPVNFSSDDPNELTRAHLYYNPKVNQVAGMLANKSYKESGPVLILVEEVEQLSHLLPFLREEVAFAHGGLTKDNRDKVPEKYWQSDPTKLVEAFNDGEIPILVGTSCISTGTDILTNKTTIYLQGGKSEIQIRQGPVGRSTRLHTPSGKTECMIYDFDITSVPTLHRHAEARTAIYTDVYDPPEYIEL